jgi:hypothetical protein
LIVPTASCSTPSTVSGAPGVASTGGHFDAQSPEQFDVGGFALSLSNR